MLASSNNFATLVAGTEYYGAWRVQMTLPITRTNLCTNPSFESGTTGWSTAGSPTPTMATTITRAHDGNQSLLVTSTGAASFFPSVTFTVTTTPGLDYIVSAWVWLPTSTPNVGLFLSGVSFGETTTRQQQWTRITMKFNASASSATIGVQAGFTASGQTFYLDDVLIVQASYLEDDLTLSVNSVSIDAQTVSDMPDGTRLQVGYPSISCDVTLAGLIDPNDESKNAAWLFGRYSTTSPLYRKDVLYSPVTVDLGLYPDTAGGVPELIRKFTGVVDDYTVNDDGTVTFTCIDTVRSTLRTVPTLPAVVTAPPYNAGLTSEFAIDYLLRRATNGAMSSWPPQRPSCVTAAGLRASAWPEVGSLDTGSTQPSFSFSAGPYGSGLSSTTSSGGFANLVYVTSSPVGTTLFLEYLVNVTTPAGAQPFVSVGASDDSELFSVKLDGNFGVTVQLSLASGAYTASATVGTAPAAGVHYVSAVVTLPAVGAHAVSGTVYYDGGAFAFSVPTGTGTGNRANASWSRVRVSADGSSAVAGVQVTTESSPVPNGDFSAGAVFDSSLNVLNVAPEVAAGDPFQTIQQICDAELAVAGGNESGVFRFYNRATIRGASSVRAITSAASLTGLGGVQTTAAGVVNHATAEYTGWNFATARTTAWSLSKARKVPKGGSLTLKATTTSLFANVDTTATNLGAGSSDVANSHYRASVDKAGTAEFGGTLTFAVTQIGSQQLQIVITNPSGQDAWLVSPANYVDIAVGTPLLRIAALAVTQADTLTAEFQYPNPASSSRFGDQALQLSGNPWIQDDDTAATLVQDIVQDMYLPKPNLTGVTIVPDPRIQLIDVVRLQDPDRTKVDEYGRVFGWRIEWSESTYAQTLDARTVALPGGWIGGVAGRSEGDQTTYGY